MGRTAATMGERPWTHWCVQHGPQDEDSGYRLFSSEDEARAFAEGKTIEPWRPGDTEPIPAKVRRCRTMQVPECLIKKVVERYLEEGVEEECSENSEAFADDSFAHWSDQFVFWEPTDEARATLIKAIQACVRTEVWEYEAELAEAGGKGGA